MMGQFPRVIIRVPFLFSFFLAGFTLRVQPAAIADVVYFGLRNVPIPTDTLAGIYLNVDTGATSSAEFTGWDANPVFGGERFYNSERFQPARAGTGFEEAIISLAPGAVVDGSLTYAIPASFGASNTHIDNGAGQFSPSSEGYLGFKLMPDGDTAEKFGWMRVVFTANEPGGVIKDWAYETSGVAITAGNILQDAPSGGVSVMTLSGAMDEASTFGSALADVGGGNVTSVVKTGEGSWTMLGDKTYTGTTVVDGGTLEVGPGDGRLSGTSGITVNNGGTFLLSGTGTGRVQDTASVTLETGGRLAFGAAIDSTETFGALTLSIYSTLDFASSDPAVNFEARFASLTLPTTGSALVLNWNGVPDTVGVTGLTDRLIFAGNSAGGFTDGQVTDRILFDIGGQLFNTRFLSTGSLEAVPFQLIQPIPEPTTVFGALALLGLIGFRERRRLRRFGRPSRRG